MKKTNYLFIIVLAVTLFFIYDFAQARELSSSIQEMGTTVKDIVLKLAIVFFVIAGASFMISMRQGVERATSAFIGVSIAAGAATLVALAQRLFG